VNRTVPPAGVEQAIKNILLDGQVFGVGATAMRRRGLTLQGGP
jgi:hypothetical protein